MRRLGVLLTALLALVGGTSGAAERDVVTARSSFAVYLTRGEWVAPVRRTVPHTTAPARTALTMLLRGPTAAERLNGYTSEIPGRTTLRGVSLSRGTLTVDVGSRYQTGGGSQSMLLRVAQVVYTATQFPSVSRVAFRLDGKPVTAIGGEGVTVSPSVNRSSFETQAPAILVEQPLPNDHVSAPLSVSGTAAVFEAQFSIDLETAAGKLLVHRNVEARAGSGVRRGFGVSIPITASADHLVVVAYDRSPKNGARIDVVRIPITISRGAAQALTTPVDGQRPNARPRCSRLPQVAARYVVPPPPFMPRIISVIRQPVPAVEPAGRGPNFKRLYRVTFFAVKGNAVLPTGHRYTQFAYVARKSIGAPWCFLKGGSGP